MKTPSQICLVFVSQCTCSSRCTLGFAIPIRRIGSNSNSIDAVCEIEICNCNDSDSGNGRFVSIKTEIHLNPFAPNTNPNNTLGEKQ